MKAVFLVAALGLAACSAGGSTMSALPGTPTAGAPRGASDLLGSAPAPKKLHLSLFDAPLDIKGLSINIAIAGVQLLSDKTVTDWLTFSSDDVVDLLNLQSSSHDFDDYAPSGKYTGVRMLIDPLASSAQVNGLNIPIVWGVASSSGASTRNAANSTAAIPVDFKVDFTVGGTAAGGSNNGNTHLALDFNVLQSVKLENGVMYITPATAAAQNPGQIKGKVLNKAGKGVGNATVTVANFNGVIVNVTTTHDDGSYHLNAIPPGTYNLTVQNSYLSKTETSVAAKGFDADVTPPSTTVTVAPEEHLQLGNLID